MLRSGMSRTSAPGSIPGLRAIAIRSTGEDTQNQILYGGVDWPPLLLGGRECNPLHFEFADIVDAGECRKD